MGKDKDKDKDKDKGKGKAKGKKVMTPLSLASPVSSSSSSSSSSGSGGEGSASSEGESSASKKMEKKKDKNKEKAAVIEQEESMPAFVKAKKFKGRKPGYVFKNDGKGNIGYYLDVKSPNALPVGNKSGSSEKKKPKKKRRASESEDEEVSPGGKTKKARVSFGKNHSKAYKDSVQALKASEPSPTKLRRSTRGVLKTN